MKRLLLLIAISVTVAGCSAEQATETTQPAEEAGAKPLVYATNYPLAYFVERIGSPVVEARLPVPADEDPAYWNPAAEDVVAMQQADLVVLNGASYESWVENVSLPPSRLVDTTAHLGERLIPLQAETTHSHGLEGEHEHSGTAFTTWLDLELAMAQAGAIQRALAARWPQHAGQFEAQLAALTEELQRLDAEMRQVVAGSSEQPVLFSHPVYQYLTSRLALNARSVHWEPDEVPDEAAWQELSTMLEEAAAEWMIWEDTPLPEVSERLESMGVRSAVFDPCANTPASGDLLSRMGDNLETLQRVFASPASVE